MCPDNEWLCKAAICITSSSVSVSPHMKPTLCAPLESGVCVCKSERSFLSCVYVKLWLTPSRCSRWQNRRFRRTFSPLAGSKPPYLERRMSQRSELLTTIYSQTVSLMVLHCLWTQKSACVSAEHTWVWWGGEFHSDIKCKLVLEDGGPDGARRRDRSKERCELGCQGSGGMR